MLPFPARRAARQVADDIGIAPGDAELCAPGGAGEQQAGTEGRDVDRDGLALVEASEQALMGMEAPQLDVARLAQADAGIEVHLVGHRGPAEIAQGDDAGRCVPAGDRQRTVGLLVQDRAVAAVQVVDARELGELVVAQEPGIAVDLGRDHHLAVEGLEHQVVVPAIQAGRQADPVVLEQAIQLVRQSARQGTGTMVGGGAMVGHMDVDVGLGPLP